MYAELRNAFIWSSNGILFHILTLDFIHIHPEAFQEFIGNMARGKCQWPCLSSLYFHIHTRRNGSLNLQNKILTFWTVCIMLVVTQSFSLVTATLGQIIHFKHTHKLYIVYRNPSINTKEWMTATSLTYSVKKSSGLFQHETSVES